MKHFNKFWVYALVLSIFIALIVWRMQSQRVTDGSAPPSTPTDQTDR
ncbi:MAG: hypothetical protein ACI9U2_004997 [Bradymonadia bacterium]